MVHEVHDRKSFLIQILESLRPGGKLLIAEPYLHVPKAKFRQIESDLIEVGLRIIAFPAVGFSRALLAEKED